MLNKLVIYTDGGARGNPGPAASAFVIYDDKKELIEKGGKYLGKTTNNQAEYRAIILALGRAKDLGAKEIEFFLDSELAVKQLNREYKVRDPDLAPLFLKIWNLSIGFKKITYTHVSRERNKEADATVNEILDKEINSPS
jgi:ribonuclease HI